MTKYKSSRLRPKKSSSIFSSFGFSGWAIIFLLCVVGVFVGSFFLGAPTKTVKQKIEPPKSVTLQVLNGCGDNGAAQQLADAMMPGDSLQVYDIIEKGDTRLASFDKTTVVDRRGSAAGDGKISNEAHGIARRLGIDDKQVILLRLEENILNIDVTVIAGKDYGAYIAKLKKAKEASL
jgi:hypothetical protein